MNKILKIIAIVAVGLALGAVIIFCCQYFPQTRFIYDTAARLTGQGVTYAKSNVPVTVAGAGGVTGLIGLGGVALNKINTLNQKVSSTEAAVKTQLDGFTAEKTKLTETITSVTGQKEKLQEQITSLTTVKTDAEKLIQEQKNQISQLTQSNENLMKMLANTPVKVIPVVQ